jgi:putative transposase
MKKTRFSEEQMVKILREADRAPVSEVAKMRGVSDVTIYAWRKRFGQLEAVDVKRLRALEAAECLSFTGPNGPLFLSRKPRRVETGSARHAHSRRSAAFVFWTVRKRVRRTRRTGFARMANHWLSARRMEQRERRKFARRGDARSISLRNPASLKPRVSIELPSLLRSSPGLTSLYAHGARHRLR